MSIRCLMPPDHDTRCPWSHNADDHLILVDRIEHDVAQDLARCRLRCVVSGCLSGTVSIAPAAALTQLVDVLASGHQSDAAVDTWAM